MPRNANGLSWRGVAERLARRARRWRPALASARGERSRRLALEIDDKEIILNDEHLAEVEIPVISRLLRLHGVGEQPGDALEQRIAALEDAVGEILGRGG